jgi:hypothetical protein
MQGQDCLNLIDTQDGQYGAARQRYELTATPPEGALPLADGDHATDCIPERVGIGTLSSHVEALVTIMFVINR